MFGQFTAKPIFKKLFASYWLISVRISLSGLNVLKKYWTKSEGVFVGRWEFFKKKGRAKQNERSKIGGW